MTTYRTCQGCIFSGQPCEARDALSKSIKGRGVTSVKWKCHNRKSKFVVGDPVWATTWDGEYDEYGDNVRAQFPGIVIREKGTKCLVYIKPGCRDREEETEFHPCEKGAGTKGFCLIPIYRLMRRDAPKEVVCSHCEFPESAGHQSGYSCSIPIPDSTTFDRAVYRAMIAAAPSQAPQGE